MAPPAAPPAQPSPRVKAPAAAKPAKPAAAPKPVPAAKKAVAVASGRVTKSQSKKAAPAPPASPPPGLVDPVEASLAAADAAEELFDVTLSTSADGVVELDLLEAFVTAEGSRSKATEAAVKLCRFLTQHGDTLRTRVKDGEGERGRLLVILPDWFAALLCRMAEDGEKPAGCDMAVVSRLLLLDQLRSAKTSNLGGYLVLPNGSLGGAFHSGHTYAGEGSSVRVVPALDWSVDVPEELLDEEGDEYDLDEARAYAEEVGDHYREAWENGWRD